MVVIALILMLTGFFVMNTTEARKLQRLDLASKQVVSTLRQVQTWGEDGRVFPLGADVSDPDRFERGYGVYVGRGSNELIIYGGAGLDADRTDENCSDCMYDSAIPGNPVDSVALPAGITLDSHFGASGNNDAHVHWRRASPITHIHKNQGYEPDVRIELKDSDGNTVYVVVNKYGLMYVE